MTGQPLGLFEDETDVGDISRPGSVIFDGSTYTVEGSGHNMWGASDSFHFVWTKVEGDFALSADVEFVGEGIESHRKACVVIRESLDADAAYADIALHGDGLTSLQYRLDPGAETLEVTANVVWAKRLGVRRVGDYVVAFADDTPIGGGVRLPATGSYYVGFAVCSHSRETSEKAIFSNVSSEVPVVGDRLFSSLEVLTVEGLGRRTVRVFDRHVEAPNWTRDDQLILNGDGKLFAIPAQGGEVTPISTGFADRCNNDHGISPDGTRIVISDQSQDDHKSVIYTLPISGGEPVRLTEHSPSYWHGWSPDGETITFCGQRDGAFGIFTIPAAGGEETRLTTAVHLDDGPEFSPDGEWIYFNSDRSGLMQIYRIRPDGSELSQVTDDGSGNWFPHISPDGRSMAYLAYEASVDGHPADKDVELKLMDLASGRITVLTAIFGGQGTINVPSWSVDSTQIAFVNYLYL
jgi:TolB protein